MLPLCMNTSVSWCFKVTVNEAAQLIAQEIIKPARIFLLKQMFGLNIIMCTLNHEILKAAMRSHSASNLREDGLNICWSRTGGEPASSKPTQ